ncbi:MAG TPA: PqqD family protein [Actinomycetota bacterium]|nr:PqqD family protein [Actinomycetota bacterium]
MSPTVPPERIGPGFVPRPRSTVRSVELDGELVLFEPTTGGLHALDPIGALVWTGFDGRATVGQVAAELSEAFGADPEAVLADVLELVRGLGRAGLLRGVGGRPGPRRATHARPTVALFDRKGVAWDGHRLLQDPPGG